MHGTPAQVRKILEHISDAMAQTEVDVRSYMTHHPEFGGLGEHLLREWSSGRQLSLQAA